MFKDLNEQVIEFIKDTQYYIILSGQINKNYKSNNKPKPIAPAVRLGLTKKIYTAQELLSFSLDKVRIDEVYRKQG